MIHARFIVPLVLLHSIACASGMDDALEAGGFSFGGGTDSGAPGASTGDENAGSTGGGATTGDEGDGTGPGGSTGMDGSGGAGPSCGDGMLDPGEACDDGNQAPGDGCEPDCTLTPVPPACGDGTPDPGMPCHVEDAPLTVPGSEGVALGDLDGDGTDDLVATEPVANRLRVFRFVDGAPVGESTFPADVDPRRVRLHDLDDDGDLDALVLGEPDPDYSTRVLLGSGSGAFGPVTASWNGVTAVAVGDLDLSGAADLAVATGGGWFGELVVMSLDPFYNNGNNSSWGDWWTAGAKVSYLAVADLDGNGIDDVIAVTDTDPAVVTLLPVQPDTTFGTPIQLGSFPPVTSMAVADVNDDGVSDVIAGLAGETKLLVLLLDDTGQIAEVRYEDVGVTANLLAVGDFDADGLRDLAVAAQDANLHLLRGTGGGTGLFTPLQAFPLAEAGAQLATGDLNGDGADDVAAAIPAADQVAIFLSNP